VNLVLKAAWLHQLFMFAWTKRVNLLDGESSRKGWESSNIEEAGWRSRMSQPLIEGVKNLAGIQV